MKTKIGFCLLALAFLSMPAAAPPEIQLSQSGDSVVDFQLENGYNIVSAPLRGQFETSALEGCNFEQISGGDAVTWGNSGELESSNTIRGTRAYIVDIGNPSGCSASLEGSEIRETSQSTLNSGWTLFSAPGEGWTFSDIESISNCELQNPYSLTIEGGQAESIGMDEELASQASGYWIYSESECSFSLDSSESSGLTVSPPTTADNQQNTSSNNDGAARRPRSNLDVYFWNGDGALVNNHRDSNRQATTSATVEKTGSTSPMNGRFTVSNHQHNVPLALNITNQNTGVELTSGVSSTNYVTIPDRDTPFGPYKQGFQKTNSYGQATTFTAEVINPNNGEVVQETDFSITIERDTATGNTGDNPAVNEGTDTDGGTVPTEGESCSGATSNEFNGDLYICQAQSGDVTNPSDYEWVKCGSATRYDSNTDVSGISCVDTQSTQESSFFDTITNDFANKNDDNVRWTGSSLEFDGSGDQNAYTTWNSDINGDKTVNIDFEVSNAGHTRLEICGSNCQDNGGDIKSTYYLFSDNNVRKDDPYDNSYDDNVLGEYQTGSEYTFSIVQSGNTVEMSLNGPGVSHSKQLSSASSFNKFSIDTEVGTSDDWSGIELTVNEVEIKDEAESQDSYDDGGLSYDQESELKGY